MVLRETIGLPVDIPFSISHAFSKIGRAALKLSTGFKYPAGNSLKRSESSSEMARSTFGCKAKATEGGSLPAEGVSRELYEVLLAALNGSEPGDDTRVVFGITVLLSFSLDGFSTATGRGLSVGAAVPAEPKRALAFLKISRNGMVMFANGLPTSRARFLPVW